MIPEKSLATDIQTLLLSTVRKVLRPLVRLLLKNGIGYTTLIEELKTLFVEVADQEFKIADKSQTDSRITILTGVHRKDVKRIRQDGPSLPQSPKPNLSAQVVAKWISSPEYQDEEGRPLGLIRGIGNGEPPSFDELVGSCSKDIRPRSLLDEWLNAGIVSLDENGMIHLNTDAFVPRDDAHQSLAFLGMNIHDHMAAAVNNMQENATPMFERCAFDDGLSLQQVRQMETFVQNQGMAFLKSVNKNNVNVRANTPTTPSEQYRINTGVYFYFEKQADANKDGDDE